MRLEFEKVNERNLFSFVRKFASEALAVVLIHKQYTTQIYAHK